MPENMVISYCNVSYSVYIVYVIYYCLNIDQTIQHIRCWYWMSLAGCSLLERKAPRVREIHRQVSPDWLDVSHYHIELAPPSQSLWLDWAQSHRRCSQKGDKEAIFKYYVEKPQPDHRLWPLFSIDCILLRFIYLISEEVLVHFNSPPQLLSGLTSF